LSENKMKRKLIIMAGAVAVLAGFSASVQAIPIAGSIGFGGTYTQNGGSLGNLGSATSMTIDTVAIQTTTGDFAGATLESFASPIAVNPGAGLGQLWQAILGSTTYTFDVTSEAQTFTSRSQLNLAGTGTITDGNAADDTLGTWQLGFGVSGDSFTWQSTSAAIVPDGGTTVTLLGGALLALGLFKRKQA
jgi:hypothetical protein